VPADTNSASLNDLVVSALRSLQIHSHAQISAALERLGLLSGKGTKRERIDEVIESLREQDVPQLVLPGGGW